NESKGANRRLIRMAALVPSVPEIRYLLARILIFPPTQKPFIIAWSLWRRRHQAAATPSVTTKGANMRNCSSRSGRVSVSAEVDEAATRHWGGKSWLS
ncbi:hypothetical protein NKH48_31040, partial [Mesorhizobium sp. M1233]|uniref:hypothetical protein n=1 Tax=Mesorhizobium sp. M1233 TaxID=2957072 RepID=UPI00333D8EA2